METNEDKTQHPEKSFKINKIANLFSQASDCRAQGNNIGWSDCLVGILIELRPKLSQEKLNECDDKLKIIRRRISNDLRLQEMADKGFRIATASDLGMATPITKQASIYDLLIELTFELQFQTEETGYGSSLDSETNRGED